MNLLRITFIYVREKLACYSIVGTSGQKQKIMDVEVAAEFIAPLLDFSTREIFFRVDKVG